MNPEIINSIPKKIREKYLPAAEDPTSEWKTLRVSKSQGIHVIAELLRKNSKKVSR